MKPKIPDYGITDLAVGRKIKKIKPTSEAPVSQGIWKAGFKEEPVNFLTINPKPVMSRLWKLKHLIENGQLLVTDKPKPIEPPIKVT